MEWSVGISERLKGIYKNEISEKQIAEVLELVKKYQVKIDKPQPLWSETDVLLISYGDSILASNEKPLNTLHTFLNKHLKGSINALHVLPYFPYSSDDGFSVIDFKQVNPELGNWDDIRALAKDYKLMSDLVINHASSKGEWFANFLKGAGFGHDFFRTEDPNNDLSKVVRPRSTPLLTPYQTSSGTQYLWTTFSADQIDLDFGNPKLLIEMLDTLLFYIKNGSKIIRLDAIAFLWKTVGTSCLHLWETHEVVKLMRDVLTQVDPEVILITETNVPNKENLSYFGNGDEAHMVYQFSLPPLLLHALNTANGNYLSEWAQSMPELPDNCTFFNFTSSHDGIGVRPLEGLLPESEKEALYKDIKKSGGLISMKSNSDGSTSPYELNITYYDALKVCKHGIDDLQNERFICSQLIMLELKGMPAFYIHSLLASPNNLKGVEATGRARTINREKLSLKSLENELQTDSDRKYVFDRLKQAIAIRKSNKDFHPSASQEIINISKQAFACKRNNNTLCISNLSNETLALNIPGKFNQCTFDLLSNTKPKELKPYQTVWLTK